MALSYLRIRSRHVLLYLTLMKCEEISQLLFQVKSSKRSATKCNGVKKIFGVNTNSTLGVDN